MELGGIHHVTAVTGDTSRNVAFYTQVLGMRLVKKTVNQDDVSAYHLFYADGVGQPRHRYDLLRLATGRPDQPRRRHRDADRIPGAEPCRARRMGNATGQLRYPA